MNWPKNVPLIVLVDGHTASAAEILAAALADRGRAVVVGSETVGKGMVQTIDPLPDGGELFVTWSQTLAPLGWPIQGLGVLPQVCTSLGPGSFESPTGLTFNRFSADGRGHPPVAAPLAFRCRHRKCWRSARHARRLKGAPADLEAARAADRQPSGLRGGTAAADSGPAKLRATRPRSRGTSLRREKRRYRL